MSATRLGLGIDAGGTQTRWAVASRDGEREGEIVAEGSASGLTGLMMGSEAGREKMKATLAEIARAALAHGAIGAVTAGLTGFSGGGEKDLLASFVAEPLGIEASKVRLGNDVEIAYLDLFEPGEGYLVYAGTGSIGVFVDASGTFHRVGGLGGIIDDAGSGFWIAIQAVREVWRKEDEGAPRTALAEELFARIGGSDWDTTRDFVYSGGFEANRGKVGKLALAVAAAAERGDPSARGILVRAGEELARMGRVLTTRFGERPIGVAGRVVTLHPSIEATMRAMLPEASLEVRVASAHVAAARLAAKS